MKYIDIKTIEGKCGGVGSWFNNVLSSPAPGDTLYYKTPHHHHGHHGQRGGNSSRLTKRRKYKTKSKSKSKSKSKTKRYIRRNCKY
uniref:Uncharacterized protein n=1 Tax=viral metagenome TaxID=1070528 RepID=A0A6C0EVF3_9ZZZZ